MYGRSSPPKARPGPPPKSRPGPPGSRPGPPGSRPPPPNSRKARPNNPPPKARQNISPQANSGSSAPALPAKSYATKSPSLPAKSYATKSPSLPAKSYGVKPVPKSTTRPPPPNASRPGPNLPSKSYQKSSPNVPPKSYHKKIPSKSGPILPNRNYQQSSNNSGDIPTSKARLNIGKPLSPSRDQVQASPATTSKPVAPKQRYRAVTQNDDSDYDDEEESENMYPTARKAHSRPPSSANMLDVSRSKPIELMGLVPPDSYDVQCIHEGYLMKRIGLGGAATHYWEVRYFRIEKNEKNETWLHWWSTHFKNTHKGKLRIQDGQSFTMIYDRDAYDEGRRRNIFGVQAKNKGSPVILDAPTRQVKRKWIELFMSLGCQNTGMVVALKINKQSVKEGWIVKLGQQVETWHRRFLVLLPQVAMYYKYKKDKRPLGVIPLTATGKVTVAPISKGKNIISLKPDDGGREYFIRCLDADQLSSWIDAFALAMKKI